MFLAPLVLIVRYVLSFLELFPLEAVELVMTEEMTKTPTVPTRTHRIRMSVFNEQQVTCPPFSHAFFFFFVRKDFCKKIEWILPRESERDLKVTRRFSESAAGAEHTAHMWTEKIPRGRRSNGVSSDVVRSPTDKTTPTLQRRQVTTGGEEKEIFFPLVVVE